jgi:hypothetical protein
MKFNQIDIGQEFEYQGERYKKATPLIANNIATGEQKLIPRSAVLKLNSQAKIIENDQANEALNNPVDVIKIIDGHCQELLEILNLFDETLDIEKTKELKKEIKNKIHQACDKLKSKLSI